MSSHEVIIKVQNLVKNYGEFKAVKGIEFEVNKGEIFGLLGPNGAGKTTTLEMLVGLRKRIKELQRLPSMILSTI